MKNSRSIGNLDDIAVGYTIYINRYGTVHQSHQRISSSGRWRYVLLFNNFFITLSLFIKSLIVTKRLCTYTIGIL